MPAEPTRRYEVSPYVEFGTFQLSDSVNVGTPLQEADRLTSGLFVGTAGGILFRSAGTDFYPTVVLELWPSEPRPDSGSWEEAEESDFDSQDGSLQFMSVMAVFAGEQIALPGPGTYQARVYCRGRDRAAALHGKALNYRGVEEWLVQIWPTPAQDAGQAS
ncbi:hypothetical protein [Micromonospora purpureochromogenes]|uniref:Uncharacterized protein n=1 Tax=Micromonospora purpureochromogenes TaxID=47872 RepID=A0ABX2RGK8_9ACTN|nr:hypothetical protein [Micromonospora purpureochromogenes]NYF55640.1 hypothetical protein [Micromonospora purpureochromogenes]